MLLWLSCSIWFILYQNYTFYQNKDNKKLTQKNVTEKDDTKGWP